MICQHCGEEIVRGVNGSNRFIELSYKTTVYRVSRRAIDKQIKAVKTDDCMVLHSDVCKGRVCQKER